MQLVGILELNIRYMTDNYNRGKINGQTAENSVVPDTTSNVQPI